MKSRRSRVIHGPIRHCRNTARWMIAAGVLTVGSASHAQELTSPPNVQLGVPQPVLSNTSLSADDLWQLNRPQVSSSPMTLPAPPRSSGVRPPAIAIRPNTQAGDEPQSAISPMASEPTFPNTTLLLTGSSIGFRSDDELQGDDNLSDPAFDAIPDDLLFDDGSQPPAGRKQESIPRVPAIDDAQSSSLAPKPNAGEPLPQPTEGATSDRRAFDALDALPEEVFSVPDFAGEGSGGTGPTNSRVAPSVSPQQPMAPQSAQPLASESRSSVPKYPEYSLLPSQPALVDPMVQRVPYDPSGFIEPAAVIMPEIMDPFATEQIYRGKFAVPVQRPWVEWGRPLYTGGIYPRGNDLFGSTNLLMPHFMVYGDFRTGVGINRNVAGDANAWANRLNLDMDLKLTATERIHGFMGPMDRAGDFTRIDFSDGTEYVSRYDMRFDTLFFEGDAGAILGGVQGTDSPFDLPFTFGFIPLIYQNGIWANDNVIGAAVALPAKHSRLLNWSNYDATFFWASDQVTTDAFAGDNNAAEFFGTAWFVDAYDGYIESDYAYVHDDVGGHRSYHNLSVAFTRRYFARLSNSVRLITNFGQSQPNDQKTASGHLLLFENSLISPYPNTFVPYCNLFYGQGSPQSLARAGIAGGVLNNVGINFETDGLTAYPTLDATGHNTYGAALGLNILGSNFSHQLVLEAAALAATGSDDFRSADGDQYALGMRYQKPLSNAWLFRTDHMVGWMRDAEDIRGSRVELRWKF